MKPGDVSTLDMEPGLPQSALAMIRTRQQEERQQFAPVTTVEPLFPWQGVGRFLDQDPKPQEWVCENCLPAKIVGAIFATGGVGKTFLALQLSACLATGTPFGPFRPAGPMKVLFIGGEDSEDIFHRRISRAIPAMGMKLGTGDQAHFKEPLLRNNLEVVSLIGTNRFLTELDSSGNPRTTKVFSRLQETIRAISGLDVLIIDPKSRFDGLNENDNSHATFFVSALEKLVTDFRLTILFTHHESKAQVRDGEVRNSSGRGASGLRDGVRWALSLGELGEKEAERYHVDPTDYIEAVVSKNNYGPRWKGPCYFRRDQDGILSATDLRAERLDAMVGELARELAISKLQFTERELINTSRDRERSQAAKEIVERLEDLFGGFKRGKDLPNVIAEAKTRGIVAEKPILAGTKYKKVLVVRDDLKAQYMAEEPETPAPENGGENG